MSHRPEVALQSLGPGVRYCIPFTINIGSIINTWSLAMSPAGIKFENSVAYTGLDERLQIGDGAQGW